LANARWASFDAESTVAVTASVSSRTASIRDQRHRLAAQPFDAPLEPANLPDQNDRGGHTDDGRDARHDCGHEDDDIDRSHPRTLPPPASEVVLPRTAAQTRRPLPPIEK
jgi:hypothetical protein